MPRLLLKQIVAVLIVFALVLDEDKQRMFIIWMLDIAGKRRGAYYLFSEQCNADVWEECWGKLLEARISLHQHDRLHRGKKDCLKYDGLKSLLRQEP